MAQGGYSGKAPSAEQVQQRAEQNKAVEARQQDRENKIRSEVEAQWAQRMEQQWHENEQEKAALRTRLQQVENERTMLLRILDAYAQAVTELQTLKGQQAFTGMNFGSKPDMTAFTDPKTRGGE